MGTTDAREFVTWVWRSLPDDRLACRPVCGLQPLDAFEVAHAVLLLRGVLPSSSASKGSAAEAPVKNAIEYPPIGSRWRDNDPRLGREIQIIEHDDENDRVACRSVAKGRLSYINVMRFNSTGRGAYTRIHDDASRTEAADALLEAVGKYIATRGGSVLVAGGIWIEHDSPMLDPYRFRVSIQCTGRVPDPPSRENGGT